MTTKLSLAVGCLLTCISCALCGAPLYSYGPGTGDQKLGDGADPAAKIDLEVNYVFFGDEYNKLCISDNGYVTFGDPVLSNKPQTFPVRTGSHSVQIARMVAPYWSDVDTRCGGDVYYREVKPVYANPELYFNITNDVFKSGVAYNFFPESAVIVTWEGVMCQNGIPCHDQRKNTFQLVLSSDGTRTIVMFRYHSLEWETSAMNVGPACAGVNCGDRLNGFNVTNNLEDIHMKLPSMSNCGTDGVLVYRVDLGPSAAAKTLLMGQMMEFAVAETMQFGVAEAELYSPYAEVAASEFNRQEQAHLQGYLAGLTASSQMVNFYAYGKPLDSTLGSSDEGTSGKVYFDKPICFYGKNYTSAIVYTNGFLTLDHFYDFPTYIPKDLKETNVPMVAPFFADADTRGYKSGMIYFRGTSDPYLLNSIKYDIESTHSVSFTPEYAFITTWDKVGFYNHHDTMLNSYQATIATDGKTSYVILNYNRVEWTSPDSTGVSIGTGLGAIPERLPVLGIGDGFSHETLIDGSQSDEQKILDVEMTAGNTGLQGLWIFEASDSSRTKSKVQNSPYVDPKFKYADYMHSDRQQKATQQKVLNDIKNLAAELQHAERHPSG